MPLHCVAECREEMLGNLESVPGINKYKPWFNEETQAISPSPDNAHPLICEGDHIVNGVALPENVINELRRLGIAISWYTSKQLEDAVRACHFDGQLVDDPDGVTFHDMITLTHDEHMANKGQAPGERHRHNMRSVQEPSHPFATHDFCERINHEREQQLASMHSCKKHVGCADYI